MSTTDNRPTMSSDFDSTPAVYRDPSLARRLCTHCKDSLKGHGIMILPIATITRGSTCTYCGGTIAGGEQRFGLGRPTRRL